MPWTDTQPGLPFSGSSPRTWQNSRAGAMRGQPKAGSQTWRIYLALRSCGHTMHELSDDTGLPINIVCARIGWLRRVGLIRDSGNSKPGPSGVPNTIWAISDCRRRIG